MPQLFRLAGKLALPLKINPAAGLVAKLEIIETFLNLAKIDLAVFGPEIIIKAGGKTSVTSLTGQPPQLASLAAGVLSVSYAQNPTGRFAGLTTGAFLAKQAAGADTLAEMAKALNDFLSQV